MIFKIVINVSLKVRNLEVKEFELNTSHQSVTPLKYSLATQADNCGNKKVTGERKLVTQPKKSHRRFRFSGKEIFTTVNFNSVRLPDNKLVELVVAKCW